MASPWYALTDNIPIQEQAVQTIIKSLLFNCPSCITKKSKKKRIYQPVSCRKNSFRERNISGPLLNTLWAQIKAPFFEKRAFRVIDVSDSVEEVLSQIDGEIFYQDRCYDVVVMKNRTDMAKVEAFYYYIRNAFAHGSFEIYSDKGKKVYNLESAKDGDIKARIRLKESTLLQYTRLSQLSASDIKSLQRRKKSENKQSEFKKLYLIINKSV